MSKIYFTFTILYIINYSLLDGYLLLYIISECGMIISYTVMLELIRPIGEVGPKTLYTSIAIHALVFGHHPSASYVSYPVPC